MGHATRVEHRRDLPVDDQQLHQRGPARPVDQDHGRRAGRDRTVLHDDVDHVANEIACRAGLATAHSRLSVHPHADEDLVVRQAEHRLAGQRRDAGSHRGGQGAGAVAHVLAEGDQPVERHPGFGGGPENLVDEDRARCPPAFVFPAARGGRHVVVHQERAHVEPRFPGQHRRRVAIDDIPLVARDQQHRARFAGDLPDAFQDHLRRRCGEDVAHDVRIQHALSDEPHCNRFVPGAVADQERGLSIHECGNGPAHHPRMRPTGHQPRVRRHEAVDHVVDDPVGRADELLHRLAFENLAYSESISATDLAPASSCPTPPFST